VPLAGALQLRFDQVRRELGPVAVIGDLNFVDMLPKTRNSKIMRRVLKGVIQDRNPGDVTTAEDEGSVEEAKQAGQQMKAEIGAQTATAGQGGASAKRRAIWGNVHELAESKGLG